MSRSFFFCVLGSALLIPQASFAKDLRIGVVNLERAVRETEEGKKAENDLKKYKDKVEASLNRQLKELYEKEDELRKAWSILKEDERRRRAEDSRKKQEDLQKQYLQAERDLMSKKTNVMMKITNKVNKIIQKIAERDKFDYIFSNAAVLWAPRHVDLTNEVIRLFNAP
jgi:outer membrane protein